MIVVGRRRGALETRQSSWLTVALPQEPGLTYSISPLNGVGDAPAVTIKVRKCAGPTT